MVIFHSYVNVYQRVLVLLANPSRHIKQHVATTIDVGLSDGRFGVQKMDQCGAFFETAFDNDVIFLNLFLCRKIYLGKLQ